MKLFRYLLFNTFDFYKNSFKENRQMVIIQTTFVFSLSLYLNFVLVCNFIEVILNFDSITFNYIKFLSIFFFVLMSFIFIKRHINEMEKELSNQVAKYGFSKVLTISYYLLTIIFFFISQGLRFSR